MNDGQTENGTKILLLINNHKNSELIRNLLRDWGYEVVSALAEGNRDLSAVFDMIIADGISLRNYKGEIEKITSESVYYIPVLLVTTREDIGAHTGGLWRLIDELLMQPIVKTELQARVQMLLRAHRFSVESHERYFVLAENNPVATMLVQDQTIIYANPALRQYTGFRSREVIGESCFSIFTANSKELCRERFRQSLKGPVAPFECTYLSSDEVRAADVYIAGMQFQRRPAQLVMLHDINSYKQYEQELFTQRELLSRIMEASPIGITRVDNDGRIVFANRAAEQILGLSRSLMADRSYDDPSWRITDFEGEPFPVEELPFNRVAETGRQVEDIRHAIVNEDGEMARLSINAAPLFTQNGSFDGIVATFKDVTQQYENENRIKRDIEEKEVMLREIHHRVRNNLNIIVSLLNLQDDKITSPEEALQAFTDSKNRIYSIALIHDQLYRSSDFAHIEFKTYTENLVHSIASSLEMEEKVRLELHIEEMHVVVDKSIPLAIILNEFISNSFRHAFPGDQKGSITISLKNKPAGGVLICSDDGVGLPDEVDIDSPSTVGFQLIQSLVSQLEGKLSVERIGGSAFRLEF